MATSIDRTDKQSMFSAFQLIEIFRELHPEMPMQMASTFLIIAMRPGISQRDLMKFSTLSQQSISRNVAALSAINRHGEPGLDLVIQRRDPRDARITVLHVTALGKRLIERVLLAVSGRESRG